MSGPEEDGITPEEERRRRDMLSRFADNPAIAPVRSGPPPTRAELEERWNSVMDGRRDTEVYSELAGAVGVLIRIVAGQATTMELAGENDPRHDVTPAEEAIHDNALCDAIGAVIIDRILAAGVAR